MSKKTNHLKNTNIEQDWQNRERKKKAGTNKGNGRIIIKPATWNYKTRLLKKKKHTIETSKQDTEVITSIHKGVKRFAPF